MKSAYIHYLCLFLSISCYKTYAQEIKIISSEFADIENITDYPLNRMEISIPSKENFLYVKIKNINNVLNDKNENLVYQIDTTNNEHSNEFPYSNYKAINKEDAILSFLFKSVENKNVKLISGNLSYLLKNSKTEILGNLNTVFAKNIISENYPFKVFKYNKKQVEDYRKAKKTLTAKEKNISVEMLEKDIKLVDDVFGPQGIQFSDNQVVLLITGNRKNIISIKFFDENDNEINVNYNEQITIENELISFNFDKKPENKWKIKIYYEDLNSVIDVPFEIKTNN